MSGAGSGRGPRRADARKPAQAAGTDAADIARRLARWFETPGMARSLPWRIGPAGRRDPYAVLVSEAMLQQTQVARVIERFPRFMARFPALAALASAPEQVVLAEWSGMGYYRRARNLHAAAGMIVEEFGGRVPTSVPDLRRLPGVGRYTAGAIASIAFDQPAPIVDGNVARVLLRIHGRDAAADDRSVQPWLWERAGGVAAATGRPGLVNEALMELGATVCLPAPAAPRCDRCPLAERCGAFRTGRQLEIPRARTRARPKFLYCGVVVLTRDDGRVLVEQRPPKGMWAGLWQAPTVEDPHGPVSAAAAAAAVGVPVRGLRPEAAFEHRTTHRRVVFQVWRAAAAAGFEPARGVWMTAARIERMGLSNPQRRILLESAGGGTLWT